MFTAALIGQIFASGGNFVANVLMARALGPYDFGFWAFGWMFVLSATAFHTATVQIPAQVLSRDDAGNVDLSFLGGACLVSLIYAAIGAAVTFIVVIVVASLGSFPAWLALGLVPLTFGWMLVEFNRKALMVVQRYRLANFYEFARAIGSILIIVALTWKLNGIPLLAITLWVLGVLITAVGLLGLAAVLQKAPADLRMLRQVVRRCWDYSRWLIPLAATSRAGPDIIVALAGTTLGPAAVGGIRAMMQIVNGFNIGFQTLQVALPIKIVELKRRGGDKAVWHLASRILIGIAVFFSLCILVLALAGDQIVLLLLGADYVVFAPILSILAIGYLALFLGYPFVCWLYAFNAGSALLIANSCAVAIALALVFPLMHLAGPLGVASAVVSIYVIEAAGFAMLAYFKVKRARRTDGRSDLDRTQQI